jgi:hypothetical protein
VLNIILYIGLVPWYDNFLSLKPNIVKYLIIYFEYIKPINVLSWLIKILCISKVYSLTNVW